VRHLQIYSMTRTKWWW